MSDEAGYSVGAVICGTEGLDGLPVEHSGFENSPPRSATQSAGYHVSASARARRLGWVVVVAGIVVSGVALGVVVMIRGQQRATEAVPPVSQSAASLPQSAAPPPAVPAGDTSAADLALCTAIAPLMTEGNNISNAYTTVGEAGTAARDAATPQFVTDTQDWVGRVQPILDTHLDASTYFRGTLQRYLDDRRLFVADLGPGPLVDSVQTMWDDSTAAYAGPLHVCDQLGVQW